MVRIKVKLETIKLTTYIQNVLLNNSMDDYTNQSIEEDCTYVFKSGSVPHLLAVSQFFNWSGIVVHCDKDGSHWLSGLSTNMND